MCQLQYQLISIIHNKCALISSNSTIQIETKNKITIEKDREI